jgi:hypothetical protein
MISIYSLLSIPSLGTNRILFTSISAGFKIIPVKVFSGALSKAASLKRQTRIIDRTSKRKGWKLGEGKLSQADRRSLLGTECQFKWGALKAED